MFKRTNKRIVLAVVTFSVMPLSGCSDNNPKLQAGLGGPQTSTPVAESSVPLTMENKDALSRLTVIDASEAGRTSFVELRHFDVYNNYRAIAASAAATGVTQLQLDDQSAGPSLMGREDVEPGCLPEALLLGD